MPSISTLFAAFAASSLLLSAEAKACPPLGAVLPPPQAPIKSEDVQKAVKNLIAGLDDVATQLNMSAISIGVKSLHEDKLLFNYHHTPKVLSGIGTEKIDENTIYRVGSVSKMFPALLALQNSKINMQDSVLKYLPDLRNGSKNDAIMNAVWEDVTIQSLTDHLSGLGTDMAMDLAVFSTGPWTDMGLPEIKKGTGPDCSGLPGTRPCTAKDLIADINKRPPVYNSYTSPVYSNIAFALLGLVVEVVTGQKFEDVVKESIYDVAGMNSSSFNGPVKSFEKTGFVPVQEPTWNSTLGVFEAAGGMFSNTVDLIAFAEAILNNQFLTPRETREWMKPQTHTSSWGYSVGGPWEILRGDNITSDGRLIDVYTKSGDLGLYHALLGLIPDYDIVISVLTAGAEVSMDAYARSKMFSAIVTHLLPAIEQAGKDEVSTSTGYVGTFVEESSNSTITLEIDDGPGLFISQFLVRGFDVLNNINSYSLSSAEGAKLPKNKPRVEGRMYPTKTGESKNNIIGGVGWRATFDARTEEQKEKIDSQLFNPGASCETWFGFDRAAYNFLSLTEFVFQRNKDNEVYAIRNPAFNVTMAKVSSNNSGHKNSTGSKDESKDAGTGGSGGEGEKGSGNASGAPPPDSSSSMLRLAGSSAVLATIFGTVLIALQL